MECVNDGELLEEARAFVDGQWDAVTDDLERLVSIDSSQDLDSAGPCAPFGAGPRAALDEMLSIARARGFTTHDCEGYCGYAHVPGASAKQLGIIAHLDVVPAGEGWTFPPFAVTRKDGYLIGRGVIDDKGPLVVAFHALRFWRERYEQQGRPFPVNVRMIYGCGEETGMEDADYYIKHYGAPDFLFTPDADFPLCYGEKGQLQVFVRSKRIEHGVITELCAGTAMNGVPASAHARVHCLSQLPAADYVDVERTGPDEVVVRASGVAGHAAMPSGSRNAVAVLAAYLLDNGLCNGDERAWLKFVLAASRVHDGSELDLACSDDDFGPLTCVASTASLDDGRFVQGIDIRFPASTSTSQLLAALKGQLAGLDAQVETVNAVEPLIVSPDSVQISALARAYEQVAGRKARLFTMGGGTYAHHFPVAVSFGPNDEERFAPASWVGSMHAADEGVSEEALRQALLIYIVALKNLFELDWS